MKHVVVVILAVQLLLLPNLVISQSNPIIDSLKKALETEISSQEKVDIYNSIAQEYRNQDSTQTAFYADKAIELSEKIGYPKGVSNAYYRIGWATMTKGYYNKSIELYHQALTFAREASYKKGEAIAYNGLGVSYFYLGDFPSALTQHFKSLEISTELNDKKWMANSYNNIGLIYHYQGNYPSSLEYHFNSLKIMEELGNKKGMSDSYSNIGKIYEQLGEYNTALEQYHKSLELREQLTEKIWAANSYRSIGKVYEVQGDYPSALEYHLKSLEIMEVVGDKYGIANAYNFIGEVYLKQEAYTAALRYQRRSLDLYNEIGAKAYATLPMLDLGKIHLAMKQYNEAISYLKRATENAQKLGRKDIIRDGAEQLAIAYEQMGLFKEAFRNMKLFKTMEDSLKSEEITKQITSRAMQYEFEKKEAVVQAEQEKKNLEQQQRLQTQKYYTYTSIGGAMALLAIALVVYRAQHKQKKANELLAKQKEEIASQAEELKAYDQMVSHDLKGPLAAISQLTQILSVNLGENTSNDNQEIIDNIEKQCHKSIGLIHGILEYASADKPAAFESDVDMTKIIDDVRSSYASVIQEKKAIVEHTDLPIIEKAIPIKVYQLFYNLIGNALKFQQPDTTPEIKIYGLKNKRIVVEDNGIGFDQSQAENIFKPLNRLTSRYEGHGIGLGTCKRIVDMHGWEIVAESEVGKGTKFIISY